jgi:hypothetical protein
MSGGILPLNLFVDTSTHLSFEFLPKLFGSNPEKRLFQMSKVSNELSSAISSGTVPLMSLYIRLRSLKLFSSEKLSGIDPERKLSERSKFMRFNIAELTWY